MTDIPKRPEPNTFTVPANAYRAQRDYEHAVAVAAVEALEWADGDLCDLPMTPHGAAAHNEWCHRCETLKRIKDSGWTP